MSATPLVAQHALSEDPGTLPPLLQPPSQNMVSSDTPAQADPAVVTSSALSVDDSQSSEASVTLPSAAPPATRALDHISVAEDRATPAVVSIPLQPVVTPTSTAIPAVIVIPATMTANRVSMQNIPVRLLPNRIVEGPLDRLEIVSIPISHNDILFGAEHLSGKTYNFSTLSFEEIWNILYPDYDSTILDALVEKLRKEYSLEHPGHSMPYDLAVNWAKAVFRLFQPDLLVRGRNVLRRSFRDGALLSLAYMLLEEVWRESDLITTSAMNPAHYTIKEFHFFRLYYVVASLNQILLIVAVTAGRQLDAHYHVCVAQNVKDHLISASYTPRRNRDMGDRISAIEQMLRQDARRAHYSSQTGIVEDPVDQISGDEDDDPSQPPARVHTVSGDKQPYKPPNRSNAPFKRRPRFFHASNQPTQGGRAHSNALPKTKWTIFPKEDHIVTEDKGKLNAKGEGCFVCGSHNHWKKDCPAHDEFRALKSVMFISSKEDYIPEHVDEDTVNAVLKRIHDLSAYAMPASKTITKTEVERAAVLNSPEELRQSYRRFHCRADKGKRRAVEPTLPRSALLSASSKIVAVTSEPDEVDLDIPDHLPTPDADATAPNVSVAVNYCSRPPGMASIGVEALHVLGRVGASATKLTRLILDSGANISLMSEGFFYTLPDSVRSKMKMGQRIKLFELTGEAKIKGFVKTPILLQATDRNWTRFDAEFHIVANMKVPILLGEDFQSAFGISVVRNPDVGSEVSLYDSPARFPAYAVSEAQRNAEAEKSRRFIRAMALGEPGLVPPPFSPAEEKVPARGESSTPTVRTPTTSGDEQVPSRGKTSIPPVSDSRGGGLEVPLIQEVEASLDNCYVDEETEEDMDVLNLARAARLSNNAPIAPPPLVEIDPTEELGLKTALMEDDKPVSTADFLKALDIGDDVPPEFKKQLEEVLWKNRMAFSLDGQLGKYEAEFPIDLKPGSQLLSVPMYGASPAKREVIDKQHKAWIDLEVIEPSKSPWGFPVVVVFRNGKPRICVDYRKLNLMSINNEFPILRQDKILQALSGSQVISSFDALSGFQQISIGEGDREKTAFRTHLGLYQFKRLPFGLTNGPSFFQRVMQTVLAPFLWLFALVYIDDIVVFSKSWPEHLVHLDKVLSAIRESGITLSPKKCHLRYSSILLLGQKVSRLGLSTHAEKVAAIVELAPPTKVVDLQKFLGMAIYFSSYIPGYSDMAAPLFNLLRKGAKFLWLAEHQQAFEAIKESLVLGHPIAGLPYRLYTDASDIALGCCLQQIQPIAIKDLKGTKIYGKLFKAFQARSPRPDLIGQSLRRGSHHLMGEIV